MDEERNRRRKKELVNQSEKQGVGVGYVKWGMRNMNS